MLNKALFQLLATSVILTGCVGKTGVTMTPTKPGITPTVVAVEPTATVVTRIPTQTKAVPTITASAPPSPEVTETATSLPLPAAEAQYLAFGMDTSGDELIWGTLPVSCLKQEQDCGQDLQIIHTGLPNNLISPAIWSPDGKQLGIVAPVDGDNFDVYVMDSSGSTAVNLTKSPEAEEDLAWSPDGKTIAFSRDVTIGQDREIWLMQSDGSNPHKLTSGGFMQWLPGNEGLIYLVSDVTTQLSDLWITDVSGTQTHNLTNSPLREVGGATLSRDGRFLAYSALDLKTQQTHLYFMDREKLVAIDLTPDLNNAGEAVFSPDGKQLAFIADSGPYEEHLYVINVDQTGLTDLSKLAGKPAIAYADDVEPQWISDSQIVFISNRTNVGSLYVINSDGTGVRKFFDPKLVKLGSVAELTRWP